jgi:hypothetical protein
VAPRLRDGGGSDAEAHERFRHGEWSGRGKRDRCPGSYRAIGDGSRRRHFAPVVGKHVTFSETVMIQCIRPDADGRKQRARDSSRAVSIR